MKYSINISSAELLYLTVEAETEPFEARRASNKKSGGCEKMRLKTSGFTASLVFSGHFFK